MKEGIMTGVKIIKNKGKKQLKKSLIVNLLGSILMKKALTFLEPKIKYLGIKEVNKKLTKKSLIEKLSIRLLSLEFKSNDSIKTKCLRYAVKKILPKL